MPLAPRDVRRALDGLETRAYRGIAYRHHAPAYSALSGEGARVHGGRWNPPDSFPVVYAASDVATVDGEFDRLLHRSRLPASALQPRQLTTLRLDLGHVLDLREPAVLQALSVGVDDLVAEDATVPQTIGQVAHDLGYEAVIARSAVGTGDVVAIFPSNRRPSSKIEIAGVRSYRAGMAD